MSKRSIALVLLMGLAGAGGVYATGEPPSPASQEAPAQEAWQREFEDICSRTQSAMTFSQEELSALIQRCDALQPEIGKLDETRKKVFTGRLRTCRGLYAYVLDSKKNENK